MSEGVVREVLSGRNGVGGMMGGTGGDGGGGWGGGWGGGDSREWLAIAATAPLPLLGLSWALLVSRLHRRLWRPVDVFVAALLSAGIAKQALTLAFALLSLLLLPPDGGRGGGGVGKEGGDMEDGTPPSSSSAMTDSGWSWDGTGIGGGASSGGREEALCSAAVWGLTSAHALQAAALASLAADRALLALGSRPRRFRAAQARYHVCVLAVVSALVGAAGVFARGGTAPPANYFDDDPCLFLPHQLDSRFALFWICLHGGLLLSGATLAIMVTARLCCCSPSRSWHRGAEEESGCCEDEEEAALPVPSPCDTSTAASTASTTASGRCGSTAALYAASAPSSGVGSKCGCAGGGGEVAMAFRWTEAPARAADIRAELRWSTVMSLMALYYLLNHLPVLVVTVLGTFTPSLLPRRWPLGTVVLWAGLAQDALLPLVLTVADSRFAGWAKRVYSGATSPASSPSANELRRQHQQQQQLRQQQLEQRRQQQQQHLLHQQLQQQLQERRRRLEMTLVSPLPTRRRIDNEPAYAITAVPSQVKKEERAFHLVPWQQKNSVSVESLFQSKSDLSQQVPSQYIHQTVATPIPQLSGSTHNGSTGGSGGREGMKFPLTNGSLFTVGADGRYPVVRNYRRGTSANGTGPVGRLGPQMITNPRCDAILPISSNRPNDCVLVKHDDDAVNFGRPGQPPPPPRHRAPLLPPSLDQAINHSEEETESDMEEEPIYATLSSLEEDCEEDADEDDDEDGDDEEEDNRPASPMSSCSVTTAANDDFEYRDAKGALAAQSQEYSNGEETEVEEVVFRLPERNIPSALGLYRLRLDEMEDAGKDGSGVGADSAADSTREGSGVIRSPHNFHRRRYRRMPPQSQARRLGGVAGIVLSVDSLQTALSRPDAVAYLDNGERMSGSVPDFKKVFVSEFI